MKIEESGGRELVLKLGLEGGCIQVFRQKADGLTCVFSARWGGTSLFDDDDNPPTTSIHATLPVFPTLNEAICSEFGEWF